MEEFCYQSPALNPTSLSLPPPPTKFNIILHGHLSFLMCQQPLSGLICCFSYTYTLFSHLPLHPFNHFYLPNPHLQGPLLFTPPLPLTSSRSKFKPTVVPKVLLKVNRLRNSMEQSPYPTPEVTVEIPWTFKSEKC